MLAATDSALARRLADFRAARAEAVMAIELTDPHGSGS